MRNIMWPYREGRNVWTWEEIKKELSNSVPFIKENPNCTTWFYLEHDDFDFYKDYAVVLGAIEVDASEKEEFPSGFRFLIKIGCQPWNSLMQEYEVDWDIPIYNEKTGDLFDCEYDADSVECALDSLNRLEKDWERMKPILKKRWNKKVKQAKKSPSGHFIVKANGDILLNS